MNAVIACYPPPPPRQVYSDPILQIFQNNQGQLVNAQNQLFFLDPQQGFLLWQNNTLVRTINGLCVRILSNGQINYVDLQTSDFRPAYKDSKICILLGNGGLWLDANGQPFDLSPQGFLMRGNVMLTTQKGEFIQKLQTGEIAIVPQQTQVLLPPGNVGIQMPRPPSHQPVVAGVEIGRQPPTLPAAVQPPVAQQTVAPQALSVEDVCVKLQSGSDEEQVEYWLALSSEMRDKVVAKMPPEAWVIFGQKLVDRGVLTRQSIVDGLINLAADNQSLKLFLIAHIEYHNAREELMQREAQQPQAAAPVSARYTRPL